MATRANATITKVRGSHAVYVSQAEAVADAIDAAARAAALSSGQTRGAPSTALIGGASR